jgi:hypothetical protein
MKSLLTLSAALSFATSASAGIAGWLTSESRDWQFVQQTGGMRIGVPTENDGRKLLPIDYDVSGLTTVTCKPTTVNSGLAVRRIEADRKNGKIVIRLFTQVVEKKSVNGPKHFADLSGIPRGSYDVYYEIPGDPQKRLGRIEIK